jgi:hypothetical protein
MGGSPTTAAGPARHGAPRFVVAEDREFADARVGSRRPSSSSAVRRPSARVASSASNRPQLASSETS